jgi:O-antigen ligase
MFGIPEPLLYLVVSILAALAALTSPLHWLIYLDLAVIGAADLEVGGARIGSSDIVFAALVLGVVLRRRSLLTQPVPNLFLWLMLGTLLSTSYLVAPLNQHQLEQPISIAYQLYRYCWQPILPYLFGVLLLSSAERARQLVVTLTVIGGTMGLIGMLQGFSGALASGPYTSGNALGGWLIVSIPCAIALLTTAYGRRRPLLITAALAMMLGTLIYTSSRGSLVGFLVGVAYLAVVLLSRRSGRRRLVKLTLIAAGLFLAAALLKPGLLLRPNVQPFLELVQGEEVSNLQWRTEQRWPHFLALARENPWLGRGDYTDPALGRNANTPHNGYLAVSVQSGFPAAALYLIFGLLAVRNGAWVFRHHHDPDLGIMVLGLAAAVVGVLVHNWVDSTLLTPREVGRMFFLVTGVLAGLRAASWSEEAITATRRATADRAEEVAIAPPSQVPHPGTGR